MHLEESRNECPGLSPTSDVPQARAPQGRPRRHPRRQPHGHPAASSPRQRRSRGRPMCPSWRKPQSPPADSLPARVRHPSRPTRHLPRDPPRARHARVSHPRRHRKIRVGKPPLFGIAAFTEGHASADAGSATPATQPQFLCAGGHCYRSTHPTKKTQLQLKGKVGGRTFAMTPHVRMAFVRIANARASAK